jgi:putative PIG3 family NAD(P)H quinone oxidoreductase
MMRAVVISHPGDPDVLVPRDVPLPEAGPGAIRVRVRAFGINRADLLQRRGRYPPPADAPADIPGLEFAGVVDAVGSGPQPWAVHDRVMGIAGGGTYADYVVVPASHAVRVPDGLTDVEAGAIPEAFVTAHDALRRADLGAGDWLLVHAVGSGVGIAALQLAKAMGARVIGTSRTADKLARAGALGLDVPVLSPARDFVEATLEATAGVGATAALDLVGGAQLPRTLAALAERGRVVLVGLTAGAAAEVDLAVILRRRLRIEGTVLRPRSVGEKAEAVAGFAADVLPLLARGVLRPVIHAVLPFNAVPEAHRIMEANANFGKLVVEVS